MTFRASLELAGAKGPLAEEVWQEAVKLLGKNKMLRTALVVGHY